MAQQTLNIGSNANDGTGDTLRVAMQKVNENFTEIYSAPGITVDSLSFTGNEITATRSNDDIVFQPAGTGAVSFPAIRIDDNNIVGTRSNDDINLLPSGTGSVVFGAIKIKGTSLSSDDSTTININDGLIVDGTLNVSGAATLTGSTNLGSTLAVASGLTTLSTLTVTSTTSLVGTTTIDNLTFNDNTIGSSSNADINLTPGGTGSVVVSNLTIDSNVNITDNVIKTTQSNSDLVIAPAGTGQVVMSKADINGGAIDNTVIGGATPLAGTFTTLSTTASLTIDGVTIADNTISSNASNANLELSGNGSGGVTVSGFTFPTSDGTSGQFITTNGLGVLSFATAGATLNNSSIDDASTTVASSSTSVLNTFAKGTFRSAKYFISAVDATNGRHEIVEANVTHDGTNAYIATFGSVSSYTSGLATYTADINGSNVRLLVTNISDNSTVFKFQRTLLNV
jgi:hypothetical protein|tara:strand:- start:96 stop:1460 length:1365 start_codon:yes stop_codon:yes gene_type:complete